MSGLWRKKNYDIIPIGRAFLNHQVFLIDNNNLEIKDDDKDYTAFITNVSNCESESASNISAYFNKIVKDAYNKGKNDAVKDNLGKMGNAKGSASNGSKSESLGSKLGKMAQPKSTFSYWK